MLCHYAMEINPLFNGYFSKKWHFVIFIGVSQNLKFNRFLHFLEMFCTVHPILMFLKNVGLPQKYYCIPGYSDPRNGAHVGIGMFMASLICHNAIMPRLTRE